MIFANKNDLKDYPFLEEDIKQCFAYAASHNLAELEKGS